MKSIAKEDALVEKRNPPLRPPRDAHEIGRASSPRV